MAVAINNGYVNFLAAGGGGSFVSFGYAGSSGSDRLLMTHIRDEINNIASAEFASQALTLDAAIYRLETWYRKNQAAGTNTLTFWFSGYNTGGAVSVADFTGVDQTTPFGTAVSASANNSSPNSGSITCPTDGMIWGSEASTYTSPGAPSVGSGVTNLGSVREGGGGQTIAGGYRTTTGAMSWSLSGSADWGCMGFPINPVAAAGGKPHPYYAQQR